MRFSRQITDGRHAVRELLSEEYRETVAWKIGRFPALTPVLYAQSLGYFGASCRHVVFIIPIGVHLGRKQHHEIHIGCGQALQRIELEPEIVRVHKAEAEHLSRCRTSGYRTENLF